MPRPWAATYNGVCGSEYGVIASMPVGNLGSVFLAYSNMTGQDCVVTIRNTSGASVYMAAAIWILGQPPVLNPGNYTTYAGPVYLDVAGKCFGWSGQIAQTTASAQGCG